MVYLVTSNEEQRKQLERARDIKSASHVPLIQRHVVWLAFIKIGSQTLLDMFGFLMHIMCVKWEKYDLLETGYCSRVNVPILV